MSLCGKMETSVEMKTAVAVIVGLFTSNSIDISALTDGKLTAKGEWGAQGCVMEFNAPCWKNAHNKIRVKKIDILNKKAYCEVIEGDILTFYKSFSFTIQVIAKIDIGCVGCKVEFNIEYEKKNSDVPQPKEFCDQCIAFTEMVDIHFSANKSIA